MEKLHTNLKVESDQNVDISGHSTEYSADQFPWRLAGTMGWSITDDHQQNSADIDDHQFD